MTSLEVHETRVFFPNQNSDKEPSMIRMSLVRNTAPSWTASGVLPSLDFAEISSESLKGKVILKSLN